MKDKEEGEKKTEREGKRVITLLREQKRCISGPNVVSRSVITFRDSIILVHRDRGRIVYKKRSAQMNANRVPMIGQQRKKSFTVDDHRGLS